MSKEVDLNGMTLAVDEENRVSKIITNGQVVGVQEKPEHMPVLVHGDEDK